MAEMPSNTVSRTVFRDTEKLIGRAAVSPVVKGQAMFEALVAVAGVDGGLTALVPAGMRAVAVEVNESRGVGGLLNPRCAVRVSGTARRPGGEMAGTSVW